MTSSPSPPPVPPDAGTHRWYLSGRLWAKLLGGFVAAGLLMAVMLLPAGMLDRLAGLPADTPTPPPSLLLGVGLVIAACTTGAVYWGVRTDLGLPVRTALYAVGYNALVVLAKFVLAPHGIYELNQRLTFETFLPVSEPVGAVLTAAVVLLLYAGVLTLIYRAFRAQVVARRRRLRARTLVLVIVGAVVFAATVGTGVALVGVLLAASALEYVGYVFTSGVSLLVGLALAGATALVVLAFRDVRDRVRVVGDASVIVAFFWLGLFVLALYHAMWVVFILLLTAAWPLKVVIPK